VWPHGPGRPGVAVAAGVLGFVTAGLTIPVLLLVLLLITDGGADPGNYVLLLGLPCAAGLIAGGVGLLARRSPAVLFWSAVAAAAVLALELLVALVTSDPPERMGSAFFVLVAIPLPALTAFLARHPATVGWATATVSPARPR